MEWTPENTFVGPAKELRLVPADLENLLHAAGFDVIKNLEVGEYHFGYLAEKKS
jgi:hypothetical protein